MQIRVFSYDSVYVEFQWKSKFLPAVGDRISEPRDAWYKDRVWTVVERAFGVGYDVNGQITCSIVDLFCTASRYDYGADPSPGVTVPEDGRVNA